MSTALDRVITGGTVVTHESMFTADVGVLDGRIAGLYEPGWAPDALVHDDARGLHVLPGAIDPHVHLRALGRSFDESCRTVSRQLAAGGATTMIDFTLPDEDGYAPAIDRYANALAQHSVVDGAAHPILMSGEHAALVGTLAESHGVTGVKVFPGTGSEVHAGVSPVDDGEMWRIMVEAARSGVIVRVHAENWEIVRETESAVRATGRTDPAAWTDARPPFAEVEAMRRALYLADQAGCGVYFVHLTTAEAIDELSRHPDLGTRVFAETCPHYLCRHSGHSGALAAKVRPAIKSSADMERLWDGASRRWLHAIGSDHVPATRDAKARGGDDAWSAVPGIPGAGTSLPVLLSYGVAAGRIGLPDVVRLSSHEPARAFGMLPRKGVVQPGSDADLVLVDLSRRVRMSAELLHAELTIFEGEKFTGWPVRTYVRGRAVMADGEILEEDGGLYIRGNTRAGRAARRA